LIFWRVVVLAEPCGAVAIVDKYSANGGLVLGDDAVVARITGRLLGDDAVAGRVMIAPGYERRTRWRTQRGRMEIRIAQAVARDAIERRCRNDAAKCACHAIAGIVGDDQKNIRRAPGRYDACWPVRLRLGRLTLDLAAEFWRWRRNLRPVDRRCCSRGAGRA